MISLGVKKEESILLSGFSYQRESQAVAGCWYSVRQSPQPSLNQRCYVLTGVVLAGARLICKIGWEENQAQQI